MAGPPLCSPEFLFLRPLSLASCTDPRPPRLLLDRPSGARPARPLDGVIGLQDGKASIACGLPETNRTSDNAPSHRVFVGRAEIGAAWSKRSNEGRDYLS